MSRTFWTRLDWITMQVARLDFICFFFLFSLFLPLLDVVSPNPLPSERSISTCCQCVPAILFIPIFHRSGGLPLSRVSDSPKFYGHFGPTSIQLCSGWENVYQSLHSSSWKCATMTSHVNQFTKVLSKSTRFLIVPR